MAEIMAIAHHRVIEAESLRSYRASLIATTVPRRFVNPTIKFGSLMVWGCFTASGVVGRLYVGTRWRKIQFTRFFNHHFRQKAKLRYIFRLFRNQINLSLENGRRFCYLNRFWCCRIPTLRFGLKSGSCRLRLLKLDAMTEQTII